MFVVGLTGGIGSGKTAASDRFAWHGIEVVDADQISRDVVEPGTPALAAIREHFDENILDENGCLDRAALRKIIFENPLEKQWLENLLHPKIGEETLRRLEAARSPYVLFVSPLLVEMGQKTLCHRLLVIDVPEELQVERTVTRDDNDRAQVERIIASQASREERLAQADDVIVNDNSLEKLHREVDALHETYTRLAAQRP